MKVTIGYIPTRRDVFSKTEALRYKGIVRDKIAGWGADLVDIEGINPEGLLFDEKDLPAVVERMKSANVDGLFFSHCNFGTEDLVAKAAKALNKPVLLWGPRDDAPLEDGLRTRDTQCGLFATGKVLRRFNVPFTYVENSWVDAPVFEKGYRDFIGVCAAVRTFRSTRVLQLGPRPDAFWSVICNEGELIEKFGITFFPLSLIDLVKLTKSIAGEDGAEYRETMNQIRDSVRVSERDEADLRKIAALKLAIKSLCLEHGCNCAAIQCWHALRFELGIMPCMVNGMLSEEGIPVACETDINGAVTAVLLQAASLGRSPVFFADMTVRHPTNDNAELLWHCGNFPPSLAAEGCGKALGHSFVFDAPNCGTGEWRLKDGEVTIFRFDGDHGGYRAFIGEGRSTDGPRTKGTYLWLEVDDWAKWERTFVEGPYIHHCAGVHAKVADILQETCKYIPGLVIDRI